MRRLIALAALLWIIPAYGEAPHSPNISSWVVYWDMPGSVKQALDQSRVLNEISVFCYQLAPGGRLIPGSSRILDARSKLRRPGSSQPKLWITVTNDFQVKPGHVRLKDAAIVHHLIARRERRAAHIQSLVALADGVDGLEIDYENLSAQDRANFSAFISELAQALHQHSRELSVIVQCKSDDRPGDGARAIDWSAVGTASDRVEVMAYHFHHASGDPGAIAPTSWVSQLARFALARIPSNKLMMVLTLSGFDWPEHAAGRSIDYGSAQALARARHQSVQRDADSDSPHFNYVDDEGRPHEVWFEDADSICQKLQALSAAGIASVGVWRLGTGDPGVWDKFSACLNHP